ncbi:MAG: M81 family metallopeptidase, partial [Flavobacteriales bacterium]
MHPDAEPHLSAAGNDALPHGLDDARQLVGADVPIVVQLDIHSNISPLMIEQADVLIGRETFPEVDMAA